MKKLIFVLIAFAGLSSKADCTLEQHLAAFQSSHSVVISDVKTTGVVPNRDIGTSRVFLTYTYKMGRTSDKWLAEIVLDINTCQLVRQGSITLQPLDYQKSSN